MEFNFIVNIFILYSIKRLYFIPNKYSKLFYIYVSSPLILCNGLYNTQIVSNKYWKFLRLLSYPDAKKYIAYQGNCTPFHTGIKNCYEISQFYKMIKNITLLYFKYYSIHAGFLIFLKHKNIKTVFITELINILQSTSFLFFQNFFQRLFLCTVPNITPFSMYFITSLSSYPVIFENKSRISQINTMMLSNVVIGSIDRFFKHYKNNIALLLLLSTLFKNKKFDKVTLFLSIITGITEYTSVPKLIKTTPKLIKQTISSNKHFNIPYWHPFL